MKGARGQGPGAGERKFAALAFLISNDASEASHLPPAPGPRPLTPDY